MGWQIPVFSLYLMVSSAIATVTAIYVWFRHRIPGSKTGSMLILSTVIWSMGYAFEIMSTEVKAKIFWNAVRYSGSEFVAIMFLSYVIRFMEIRKINNTTQILLILSPMIATLLAFTNQYHGLIWSKVTVDAMSPSTPLNLECGILFWIITGFDYLLLLSSGFLFFRMLFHSHKLYRIRVTALLICLLVPWIFDILNNFKLLSFELDLTPLLLNIVTVSIAWISPERLYRSDIVTVARESIIDRMQDAILVLDMHDRLIDANTAAMDLAGLSTSDLLGEQLGTAWPQFLVQLKVSRGGNNVAREIMLMKGGEERIFDVSISSLADWQEKIGGRIVVLRDITEHKRYSAHLEQLVDEKTRQLRDAERLATIGETAAMVGHDLRNPLQVIVGTIYFIRRRLRDAVTSPMESSDRREMEEMIEKIGEQTEYMNKIVSDLQDYARPIRPQLVEVKLDQLIMKAISLAKVPEYVEVYVVVEDEFPNLWIDEALMSRVFTNLFVNAVQAMPSGGELTIKGYRIGDEVGISVEDTGVGIPHEDLEKIFQPLYSTKPKGAGFGLPVCKRIVEMHDGSISVESRMGLGSTFTVHLPYQEKYCDQIHDLDILRDEVIGNR